MIETRLGGDLAAERQGLRQTERRVEKEQSIRSAVAKMLAVYGPAVRVTDHWPDDPFAVGIARSDTPNLLVYVASYPGGKFHLSFECPPGPEEAAAGFPYHPAGDATCESVDEVVAAVGKHLQVQRT